MTVVAIETDPTLSPSKVAPSPAAPASDASKAWIGDMRAGIRARLFADTDVVILDEPISGLDPHQIVEMREVVRSLKARATVLISSHILSEVALTCDRVLVVHQGRIVAEGSTDELARSGRADAVALTLRGSADAVGAALEASGVVASFDVREADDLVRVRAELNADVDGRERLVAHLVGAGLGVVAVQDPVSELERAFLELTRGEAVPSAKEAS